MNLIMQCVDADGFMPFVADLMHYEYSDDLLDYLDNDCVYFVYCDVNHKPYAFAIAYYSDEYDQGIPEQIAGDSLIIAVLEVDPDHQKQGIGSSFISDIQKSISVSSIALLPTESAEPFWLKQGFITNDDFCPWLVRFG